MPQGATPSTIGDSSMNPDKLDFTNWFWIFRDFLVKAIDTTNLYDVSQCVSGTVAVGGATLGSIAGYACKLNTGAVTNQVASFFMGIGQFDTTGSNRLSIIAKLSNLDANSLVQFGLINYSETPFTANAQGHYFDWNGTVFSTITGNGGTLTTTNISTPSTSAGHCFEIRQTTGIVKFYIDGTLVATHTTNLTDFTAPKFSIKTLTTAAKSMYVFSILYALKIN